MTKFKTTSRSLISVALFMLLVSCDMPADLGRFKGLEQRVYKYYSLKQSNDWEVVYTFRTPAYRQSVTKEKFVTQMKEDNKQWKLKSFRIVSASEKDGKVHLKIAFVEIPPATYFKERVPQGLKVGEFEMEEDSIWVRVSDEWYCYTPGTRTHLSLNAPLVYQ